ncbi:MAG: choice-of-anchor J domain-containing protein [Prevotellaceae bacterium]|jgi:hypothetical protein|nr:choice-of-anchor J domain-containing protein [Prevotellaceae bacterium]
MKKLITLAICAFALLLQTGAFAQPTLYGYRTVPEDGMGFVSFDANLPGNLTQINYFREVSNIVIGDYNRFSAGEFLKGDVYMASYYRDAYKNQTVQNIVRLNSDTWELLSQTPISAASADSEPALLSDMAYDYSSNTMYGIQSNGNTQTAALYTVDLSTGKITELVQLQTGIICFAVDLLGNGYGIDYAGNLQKVNLSNGLTTLVGATGVAVASNLQSLAFDHNTGKLYWARITSAEDGSLYEVNKLTGIADNKGLIGASSEIIGLFTPYYTSQNIPDKVTHATFVADNTGVAPYSVTITWDNPTVAVSGNALTQLSEIVIERNGVVVHTVSNPVIGASETWTDTDIPASGDYKYSIYGVTDGHSGRSTEYVVFVGVDECQISSVPYTYGFEEDNECFTSIWFTEANRPHRSDLYAHTGEYSWRFSSSNDGWPYDQYLIFPRLPSNNKTIELSFWYFVPTEYGTEYLVLGYSNTNSNYENFHWIDIIREPAAGSGWVKYRTVLPADAKYVALHYPVVYRWDMYIDDITIDEYVDYDVSPSKLVAPHTAKNLTVAEAVTVTLQNKGMETVSNIPVSLTVDGIEIAAETVTATLASNQTYDYTFTTATADFSALGKHTVKIIASLDNDSKRANDTLRTNIYNLGDCSVEMPLYQDFEEETDLYCWGRQNNFPENFLGMSPDRVFNGNYSWRFSSANGDRDLDSDNQQYLISPKMPAVANQKIIRFKYYVPANNSLRIRIGYVTNDADPEDANWETSVLWHPFAYLDKTTDWIEFANTVPAETRYVLIHFVPDAGIYADLYIDDLSIRERTTQDFAITDIVSPKTSTDLAFAETVTVKVKNVGSDAINATIPMRYSVNGIEIGSGDFAANMNPEEEAAYTFTQTADLGADGAAYTIRAYTDPVWTGDNATDNNEYARTVTNLPGGCEISGFPYSENFDAAIPCWTVYDIDGVSAGRWQRKLNVAHSGEWSMHHARYNAQDGWLVSPKFMLHADSTSFVSFWQKNDYANGYEFGKNSIWVSEGSRNPYDNDFVQIWTPNSVNDSWEQAKVSLYPYKGKNIYVAFRYQGHLAHEWNIDDIVIFKDKKTDAAALEITSPVSAGDLAIELVTVRVQNNGTEPMTNLPLVLKVDGQVIATEYVQTTLLPLQEISYTFTAQVDLSEAKEYAISVTVDIEDDEVASNNTVLAFVTNAGTCAVSEFTWTEGFEKTDQLGIPDFVCWMVYDDDGDAVNWKPVRSGAPAPHGGEIMAVHDYGGNYQSGWLISPKISLPATGIYQLKFWSFNVYSEAYGTNSVLISTNGNRSPLTGNYDEKWIPDVADVQEEWTESHVNLADYAGQDIYIAFRYSGEDAHVWLLDDISISQLLVNNDVGIQNVSLENQDNNAEVQVNAVIRNDGTNTITSVKAAYLVNDETPVEQTFAVNITSGHSQAVTFTQKVDMSSFGKYTVKAYTLLDGDSNTANDTALAVFRNNEALTLRGYRLNPEYLAGSVSFLSDNPGTVTQNNSYLPGANYIISAGEFYDEKIYAYAWDNDISAPQSLFITLSQDWVQTASITVADRIYDMAYSYSDNTMYAISNDEETSLSDLRTVDLATGQTSVVVQLDRRFRTLAINLKGEIYGVDKDGWVCHINKTDGTSYIVSAPEFLPDSRFYQSMAFDHNSKPERLFWASVTFDYTTDVHTWGGRLIEIDVENGDWFNPGLIDNTVVGSDGATSGSQVVALHTRCPKEINAVNNSFADNSSLRVYPNPAKGEVFISNLPDNAVIKIIDITGRLINTYKTNEATAKLNLNVKSGIYFVEVLKNGTIFANRKLIVK